jgi:hypothetical protein
MNCWHCERPAHGVCQFCGRAICKDHTKYLPFIVDIFTDSQGEYKALVVGDALYCGICKPKEDPVDLPELK